jgi:uncharacterized surface protein with fasciclin (FAS1) repeats
MKRTALFAAILLASAAPVFAQTMSEPTVRVGGQAMFPSKTIVANAVNSADHTTLVAAVKAAGLVDTLNGPGPFTVFAPTNEAFAMLPAGTVDNLVKPENKAMLTKILTYHVVAGSYDTNKLRSLILEGNGTATLNTVSGSKLWLMMNGSSNIAVKDEKGDVADITIADRARAASPQGRPHVPLRRRNQHAHPSPRGAYHALDQCRRNHADDHQRLADLQRLATVSLRVPVMDDAGWLARRRACLAFRGDVAAGREFCDLSRLWACVRACQASPVSSAPARDLARCNAGTAIQAAA